MMREKSAENGTKYYPTSFRLSNFSQSNLDMRVATTIALDFVHIFKGAFSRLKNKNDALLSVVFYKNFAT